MEHRCHKRRGISLQVSVRAPARVETAGTVHNISTDGAFMRLERGSLAPGTPLRISLLISRLHAPWEVSAMVIHSRGNGIGVMFASPLPERLAHALPWLPETA